MLRFGTQINRLVALNMQTVSRIPSSRNTQKLITRKMTQQRSPVDWNTSIPTKAAKDKDKIAPLGWFLLVG